MSSFFSEAKILIYGFINQCQLAVVRCFGQIGDLIRDFLVVDTEVVDKDYFDGTWLGKGWQYTAALLFGGGVGSVLGIVEKCGGSKNGDRSSWLAAAILGRFLIAATDQIDRNYRL